MEWEMVRSSDESIEIKLIPEELPHGHGSTIVLRSDFAEISLGRGNNYRQLEMKMAIIRLKNLEVYIFGGKTLYHLIYNHLDGNIKIDAGLHESICKKIVEEVFAEMSKSPKFIEFMMLLLQNQYKQGIAEGRRQKIAEFRKFMNEE